MLASESVPVVVIVPPVKPVPVATEVTVPVLLVNATPPEYTVLAKYPRPLDESKNQVATPPAAPYRPHAPEGALAGFPSAVPPVYVYPMPYIFPRLVVPGT